MAESIVSQCDRPINKVMIIHLNKGETKYSSFWVIPYEAFWLGLFRATTDRLSMAKNDY